MIRKINVKMRLSTKGVKISQTGNAIFEFHCVSVTRFHWPWYIASGRDVEGVEEEWQQEHKVCIEWLCVCLRLSS